MTEATPTHAELREHAGALRLHGLQAHWAEVMGDPQQAHWVAQMLSWEAAERGRRQGRPEWLDGRKTETDKELGP